MIAMLDIILQLLNDDEFNSSVKFSLLKFKPQDKILVQGTVHQKLFLIKSGKVRVIVSTEFEGKTQFRPGIADLGPNDIFGEFGLLDELPASADVNAVIDSELIEIDIPSLKDYLDTHPEIGYKILTSMGKTLVTRLRHADKTIINLYAWGMKANKLDQYLE